MVQKMKSNISIDNSFDVLLNEYKNNETKNKLLDVHGISDKYLDIIEYSKTFFNSNTGKSIADYSIDSNANVAENSIVQFESEVKKPQMKLRSLDLLYRSIRKNFSDNDAKMCIDKILNGSVFINDLKSIDKPYCFAYETSNICNEGLNFFNTNKAKPPTKSKTFINHVKEATGCISNNQTGAIAYPDFFVNLDYFYRKELGENYTYNLYQNLEKSDDDYDGHYNDHVDEIYRKRKIVEDDFQDLVWSINSPYRSHESPFTNLSLLDSGFLEFLFKDFSYSDFSKPNFESIKKLSIFFLKHFNKMNREEGIFTFPVLTLALSLDKNDEYIDNDFNLKTSEHNYTQCIGNIYQGLPTSLSSCCRMENNILEMEDVKTSNSFGVGGLSIGSVRVCGLNLPRISFECKQNGTDFTTLLNENLECVRKILFSQRKIIKERIDAGILPFYKNHWCELSKQYSTIGFVGLFECCETMFKYDLDKDYHTLCEKKVIYDGFHKWYTKQSIEILSIIKKKYKQFTLEDGFKYNLEQIPAESMAVRLAKIDNILGYNKKYDIYSNQYYPLTFDVDLSKRIEIQGELDKITSGGAILHINIEDDEDLELEQYLYLTDYCRKKGVKYFAFNRRHYKCKNNHIETKINSNGRCLKCDSVVNIFTRVVGFIVDVTNLNKTRREKEYINRIFYKNIKV